MLDIRVRIPNSSTTPTLYLLITRVISFIILLLIATTTIR